MSDKHKVPMIIQKTV